MFVSTVGKPVLPAAATHLNSRFSSRHFCLESLLGLHLKLVVDALEPHELLMIARLHHAAVRVHQDHVAALDRRQPVGDGEGGSAHQGRLQRFPQAKIGPERPFMTLEKALNIS